MPDKKTTVDQLVLEERKVKALEKIANVLDALTLWFEDIDKTELISRSLTMQINFKKFQKNCLKLFGFF